MSGTKQLTQEEFWDISAKICNSSALNHSERSVCSWTLGEFWKELEERGLAQVETKEGE